MIYDVIYDHLKEVREAKVGTIQCPATTSDPEHTVSQTIDKIVKNDSYDVFFKSAKTVYGTNVRELLSARHITGMKAKPFFTQFHQYHQMTLWKRLQRLLAITERDQSQ